MNSKPHDSEAERQRWDAACISELLKHGGNSADLKQLKAQLEKFRENRDAQLADSDSIPE